ncbi:tetratricopeptide repeat protein [Pedobacter sp.]|uniref:tetratricopeptide repeat protein n=1 Tax=Pedobacter sp. TaxID=1411316 RepID=UPI0031E0FB87
MKKYILTLFFSLYVYHQGFACINGDYLELADASFLYEDPIRNVPYGHEINRKELTATLLRMDSLYKRTNDIAYLSDKGLVLIFLGRYQEAINIYLEIELSRPDRYITAANLGTAYELAGQNEKALLWIKRAVKIDPGSHHGSEWIHVRILEAKIKGANYVNSQYLLKTNFGDGAIPYSTYSEEQLSDLFNALYYQLNERNTFVKPKDDIVAVLLYDLGNIAFLINNFKDAMRIYQLAKKYGFDPKLCDERIIEAATYLKLGKKVDRTQKVPISKLRQSTKANYYLVGVPIVLIAVGVVIYIRRKKRRSI